jgi:hypothetical protein
MFPPGELKHPARQQANRLFAAGIFRMFKAHLNEAGQASARFADPNICFGSTLTTFDALMKERYENDLVEKLMYPENPFLAKLQKLGDTEMVGSDMPVPIQLTLPQSVGGVFSTVQTKATTTGGNTTSTRFVITAGDYYGVVHIGDKVLKSSRTNRGAFLANKELEIDGLFEQAAESLSIAAWGNGGQSIGRRLGINGAGDVVTLYEAMDAQNFEIGMDIVASDNDGATATDTLRGGTAATLTGVGRENGTITATDWADITSFANGDYLFRASDFAGDTGNVIMKGVQAFITATNTPPALWGITAATRATDPQRLAGCRVANAELAGKTIDERIKILLSRMTSRFKAKRPTAGWMNDEDFQVLETLMAAKGIRPLEDETTQFGFAKISIATTAGTLPIFCDRHVPKGHFFALRMEDWGISSIGELTSFQNEDGLQILRRATSTDYEARLISYPLVFCRAPKNSGRCSLQ